MQSLKTQNKLKELEIMCQNVFLISAFLDIEKFDEFWSKNAHVSRTQGVRHDIHILFGFSLGKV